LVTSLHFASKYAALGRSKEQQRAFEQPFYQPSVSQSAWFIRWLYELL